MNFIFMITLVISTLLIKESIGAATGGHSSGGGGGHGWNYDTQGPDAWQHDYENCRGQKQSPIDIKKDELEYDKNLRGFRLINYDKTFSWNVTHNGHTVVVNRLDGLNQQVGVEGSDFNSQFNLLQFHFHWGYNKYQGSEHTVDGVKFPLEMHLVHRSGKGTFTVLGFLFHLMEKDNEKLNPLLEAVNATTSQEHHHTAMFSLDTLIPLDLEGYYRYTGSLTTPPCTEGVIWNVFTSHIPISANQLKSFHNNQLKINFREPQRYYNRKVFSSLPVESHGSHDSHGSSKSKQCVNAAQSLASVDFKLPLLASLISILYLKSF